MAEEKELKDLIPKSQSKMQSDQNKKIPKYESELILEQEIPNFGSELLFHTRLKTNEKADVNRQTKQSENDLEK